MNDLSDPPPITLKADDQAGLYVLYDADRAEDFCECLAADKVEFWFNPPNAEHLAQPGKAIFVFGKEHPRAVANELEMVGAQVVIDPDVVFPEDLYHPPVKQLLALGEAHEDEKLIYAALGLSQNHVPALIRMATDDQLHNGPPDSLVVWAPVHAWRALAELRAAEAIGPLMDLFRRVDEAWDDWVSSDLPKSLAEFGAVALAPLTAYLADATHGERSRVAAAETIGLVGQKHPDTRADCITRLSAQLEHFAEQSERLNAFLMAPLWDLRAVEAMPVIERAFASGRVDESVQGDLEDVQIEFGLKTRREHPPKPNSITIMGEEFRAKWRAMGLPLPDAAGNFPELNNDFPALDTTPPALALPYRAPPKVGRNDPCPCGSGKKFKKCCGT